MNQNLNDMETLLCVGKMLVALGLLDNYDQRWCREIRDVYENLRYRDEQKAYREQN